MFRSCVRKTCRGSFAALVFLWMLLPFNWTGDVAHGLVGKVGTLVATRLSTGDTVQGEIGAIITPELSGKRGAAMVAVFKGIPYAQPPVGDLRWRAPRPFAKLPRNPYSAVAFGPSCPQEVTPGQRAGRGGSGVEASLDADGGNSKMSEDCLYLNVWTPSLEAKDRLPVLVWIHGGGFVRGTSANQHTNGARLASHGAVVVSFNYRLGPLGFFHHGAFHGDPDPKVNFGLLDQMEALRWVKANIANFGGDPNRVMIFGSSAGGASVQWLSISPRIRDEGLFHAAVSQSGGGTGQKLQAFSRGGGKSVTAQSLGEDFFRSLNRDSACANPTGKKDLAGLTLGQVESRHGPAVALRYCVSTEQLAGSFGTGYDAGGRVAKREFRDYPFVDGITVTFGSVAEGYARGAQVDVPIIFGFSTYEMSVAIGLGQKLDLEWASRMLSEQKIAAPPSADELKRMYGNPSENDLVAQLYRDIVYGMPAQVLAGLHARKKRSPAYVYRYGYVSARKKNGRPNMAPHSSEVVSLFGNFPRGERRPMAKLPPQVLNDIEVSEMMMRYWINLAATGNPNRGDGGDVKEAFELPPWPAYDPGKRNILVIENGGRGDGGKVVKSISSSSELLNGVVSRWEDPNPAGI